MASDVSENGKWFEKKSKCILSLPRNFFSLYKEKKMCALLNFSQEELALTKSKNGQN